MIEKDEIQNAAEKFDISIPDVERDYVYGWLLCGIYGHSELKTLLILKGGNAFRKTYLEETRFSADLDFSTEIAIDINLLERELWKVCDFITDSTGITFDKTDALVRKKDFSNSKINVYEARLHFKDFYGKSDEVLIKIKLDIVEFDRILLPVQSRQIIHPYSDSDQCVATIQCLKIEEMLAAKLKCLLQRRHSLDLFDLVYSVFLNKNIQINKTEVVSTFLKKTIFSKSPGSAAKLLLGLPFSKMEELWSKDLICPKESKIPFSVALEKFQELIRSLFETSATNTTENIFYPSHLRNMILEAGATKKLLSISYQGKTREIEPYALSYKQRDDGHAEEYFYAWDLTGGSSKPGIKTFLNKNITEMKILDKDFSPRFPIELSKAGEMPSAGYFSKPTFSTVDRGQRPRFPGRQTFTIECVICGKKFKRQKMDTVINSHKSPNGTTCFGRRGIII